MVNVNDDKMVVDFTDGPRARMVDPRTYHYS